MKCSEILSQGTIWEFKVYICIYGEGNYFRMKARHRKELWKEENCENQLTQTYNFTDGTIYELPHFHL